MAGYQVHWTRAARDLWREIGDRRIQARLLEVAGRLAHSPEQRGRALNDELAGFWSLHWSRWRIIYSIGEESHQVHIHIIGLRQQGKRRDVYSMARKFLRQGFLEIPEEGGTKPSL